MTVKSIKDCISKSLRKEALREERIRGLPIVELDGLIHVVQPLDAEATLDWHTIESPRRLRKTYELHKLNIVKHFVIELLDYEMRTFHNAKIIIENTRVTIEVYTHEIDDITNADRDYAKYADLLYTDAIALLNAQNLAQPIGL